MPTISTQSILFNPRNPLCVPNLSGRLKEHEKTCDECGGSGYYDDCEEGEEPEACGACEGEGSSWWPCWYGEDKGECYYCGEEDVLLAHMYESASEWDAQYVCLPCYLKQHKDDCGCDKWEWAEKRILGLL